MDSIDEFGGFLVPEEFQDELEMLLRDNKPIPGPIIRIPIPKNCDSVKWNGDVIWTRDGK